MRQVACVSRSKGTEPVRGILLDRDGVINRERADYVKHWHEFIFLPGVLDALKRLAALPVPILVITNQSVIGRGIVNHQRIDAIHKEAQTAIEAAGGRIDWFFLCPHHPNEQCGCRKPQPGLLQQAAAKFALSLEHSVFVGDAMTDYEAACAAGCQSILVESGRQGPELRSYFARKLGTTNANQTMGAALHQHPPLPTPTGTLQTVRQMPPIVQDLAAAVDLIVAQWDASFLAADVSDDPAVAIKTGLSTSTELRS